MKIELDVTTDSRDELMLMMLKDDFDFIKKYPSTHPDDMVLDKKRLKALKCLIKYYSILSEYEEWKKLYE